MKMRYLSAHYVFPISSPPLKNGIIGVNDDGTINQIIDADDKPEECENPEFYNGILVPGFVNAHCHLELSHLHGVIEPNSGLPEFISSIGKHRRASEETIIAAAKAADGEMRQNGTVAVGDISNNACTLSVKRDSPILYRTFVEVFGLDNSRSEEIFTAAKQVEQKYRRTGMPACIAPHAIYSVSGALWEALYQSYQSYQSSPPQVISVHHQESGEETDIYREGKGELSQMTDCLQEASRCLLVHNTFSSEDDLTKYISQRERFYFVLCPQSNLFIQNRLPDFLLFSKQKLYQNVCLGTDSSASNTGLSILEEMKIIQRHAPEIPLEMLLRWATLNGAKSLKFDHLLGSFDKGKAPGINLITHVDFESQRLTTESAVKPLALPGSFV